MSSKEKNKTAGQAPALFDTRMELITPEIAGKYLETSTGNRAIKEVMLRELVSDLKEGRWRVTPEGISFDESGHLRDGHHRMHAIIKAGVSAYLFVVRGVPSSAFEKVNLGRSRTVYDRLQMLYGVGSAHRASSLGRIFHALSKGWSAPNASTWPLSQQAEDIYLHIVANPRSFEFGVKNYSGKGRAIGVPSAIMGVLTWCYTISPEKIGDMGVKLSSKIGIEAGSPEAALVALGSPKGTAEIPDFMVRTLIAAYHKVKGTKSIKVLHTKADGYIEEVRAWRKKAGNL